MSRKEEIMDPVNKTFSRVIWACSLLGISFMSSFGVLYFLGFNPSLDTSLVINNWNKPVDQFWIELKGEKVDNYIWFLSTIRSSDSLCFVGIIIMCLTPIIGICFSLFKTKGFYLILLLIIIGEFVFSLIYSFI